MLNKKPPAYLKLMALLFFNLLPHYKKCSVKTPTTGAKAKALDTTVDFLLNGNTEDKAKASLNDAEVIRY